LKRRRYPILAVLRCFETGKTAVYKLGDVLRSEVLSKIEIPVAAVFP